MSRNRRNVEENEQNNEMVDERESVNNGQWREILQKSIDLKEISERGNDDCIKEANDIIVKTDEVVNQVQDSGTAFIDAQILNNTAHIYKNAFEKMDSRISDFRPKEYAENILTYLEACAEGGNIWLKLAEEASLAFKNTGGWNWQFGAFDVENLDGLPERKRTRKPVVVDEDRPKKNPKQVQSVDKEGEDLEKHFKLVKKIMRDWETSHKEPLQFWDFVLNPESFSETIENIFHISHLVKEGVIHLSLDRDGLPVVKTVKNVENSAYWEKNKIPIAVTIDMDQWEELVKTFGRVRPMIPSRHLSA